jgi:hypothetical protein
MVTVEVGVVTIALRVTLRFIPLRMEEHALGQYRGDANLVRTVVATCSILSHIAVDFCRMVLIPLRIFSQ